MNSKPKQNPGIFWMDPTGRPETSRGSLPGDDSSDVLIVGGGFSGLWTAYYVLKNAPLTKVTVLESEIVGFGASGRNGGWCSESIAGIEALFARKQTRPDAIELMRQMRDAVDEVGRVSAREDIPCDYKKGGTIQVGITEGQMRQIREDHRDLMKVWTEADYRLLSTRETRDFVSVQGARGALFSAHCAVIHPGKLVRGLARVVESLGGRIFENSPVTAIEPGRAMCLNYVVKTKHIVIATEAYSGSISGLGRRIAPVHSLLLATEPLSQQVLQEIGLETRPAFGDGRHMPIFGQRTADGRIVFGARGLYYFGSRIRNDFSDQDAYFRGIHKTLLSLFPALRDATVTHKWGGALGVPHNRRAGIVHNTRTGISALGGYIGVGVCASNLVARTLADLLTGKDTERTRLSFVRRTQDDSPFSDRWVAEPFRWLGVATGCALMEGGDGLDLMGMSGAARLCYRARDLLL
jgi:glycine/D-amino acid oxidase-like deaminating enzyme